MPKKDKTIEPSDQRPDFAAMRSHCQEGRATLQSGERFVDAAEAYTLHLEDRLGTTTEPPPPTFELEKKLSDAMAIIAKCGAQFRMYEASHREKGKRLVESGSPDIADMAFAKADINASFANLCGVLDKPADPMQHAGEDDVLATEGAN